MSLQAKQMKSDIKSPTDRMIEKWPPTKEELDLATEYVMNRPTNVARQIDYFAALFAKQRLETIKKNEQASGPG